MRILIALVLTCVGCSSSPDTDDGRIWIEVRNETDRPVHGILVAPPLVTSQPVSLSPGEVRQWWVPRSWFPKRVIFVLERGKE